jgi:hypothetical protein
VQKQQKYAYKRTLLRMEALNHMQDLVTKSAVEGQVTQKNFKIILSHLQRIIYNLNMLQMRTLAQNMNSHSDLLALIKNKQDLRAILAKELSDIKSSMLLFALWLYLLYCKCN